MTRSWTPNILGLSILQLLERAPLSGYDLKKRFATSLAYGWYAHDSQIYPQLRQLESHGMVESRVEASSVGPDRRVYSLTAQGDAALRDWLQAPLDVTRQKSELLLRVWSMDLLRPEAFLDLLADVRRQVQEHGQQPADIHEKLLARHGPPEAIDDPRHVGVQLCLEHDMQLAQARLAWLQRMIALAELRAAPGDAASNHPEPAGHA